MEEGNDQPTGDAYVYALKDEEAYLQRDEDEKPEIFTEPPDPSWFKCSFCRKTDRRVLFGAEIQSGTPTPSPSSRRSSSANECGAVIGNRERHDQWHERLANVLSAEDQ